MVQCSLIVLKMYYSHTNHGDFNASKSKRYYTYNLFYGKLILKFKLNVFSLENRDFNSFRSSNIICHEQIALFLFVISHDLYICIRICCFLLTQTSKYDRSYANKNGKPIPLGMHQLRLVCLGGILCKFLCGPAQPSWPNFNSEKLSKVVVKQNTPALHFCGADKTRYLILNISGR